MRYPNNDKSFQEYLMALKWIFVSNFVLNYISQCSFASYKYIKGCIGYGFVCVCVFWTSAFLYNIFMRFAFWMVRIVWFP